MKTLVKDLQKFVEDEWQKFDELYGSKKEVISWECSFKMHLVEKLGSDDPEV